MCVSEYIIKSIANEKKFPTIGVVKIEKDDYPKVGEDYMISNDFTFTVD